MSIQPFVTLVVGFVAGAALFSSEPSRSDRTRVADPLARTRRTTAPARQPTLARAAPPTPALAAPAVRRVVHENTGPALELHWTPDGRTRYGYVALWKHELATWIDSGELAELLAREPTMLRDFLLALAIEKGDMDRASELIASLPNVRDDARAEIVRQLEQRGKGAAALEARVQAFAEGLGDPELLRPLLDTVPERALALLDAEEERIGLDWSERANRAHVLVRLGRPDDARPILLELMRTDDLSDEALALLIEVAPDEFERHHKKTFDVQYPCGSPYAYSRQALLQLYEAQGRTAEAVALLGGTELPADDDDLATVVRLIPDTMRPKLEARLAAEPGDADLWGFLGECLSAQQDEAGAADAWLHAFELGDPSWVERAFAVTPDRTLARIETRIRADETADDWGWYGDLCWRAGKRGDAQRAWIRARELEPFWYEWFDRVERVIAGVDPLPDDEDTAKLWEMIEACLR